MNQVTDKEFLLNIFKTEEIENFIENDILTCKNQEYRFNFRFIPFENLFLVAKADAKDTEYVHLNYDSVTFLECLRKMRLRSNFQKALEIGCGAGLISLEIAKIASEVDAVDINPYAVEVMDINAKLNNISNITAFSSDSFCNVQGKYDLVVSDPPFELMPEEDKHILHRYGGFLGMEIALKIFSGLDEHLLDNGEAIIFTNSYIRNFKVNTLKDALYNLFKNKKFKITLHPLSYQINPEYHPIYKQHNITHSIAYIIQVKKANNFEMIVLPLGILNRIKEILRVVYLYLVIFLKNLKSKL